MTIDNGFFLEKLAGDEYFCTYVFVVLVFLAKVVETADQYLTADVVVDVLLGFVVDVLKPVTKLSSVLQIQETGSRDMMNS